MIEYKQELEDTLSNIGYLYSGDVINSIDSPYFEYSKYGEFSKNFISNFIMDIYYKSLKNVINDPISSTIIPYSDIDIYKIYNKIVEKCKTPLYCFANSETIEYISSTNTIHISYLPPFIYQKFKYMNLTIYKTPFLSKDIIYVVDGGIQSMVYSIQNMEYDIKKKDHYYKHTMYNSIYQCNYKSYRFEIRNIGEYRDKLISKILK